MRELIVVGAGGFGQEAVWVAEAMNAGLSAADKWKVLGYVDDAVKLHGHDFYDFRVLGFPHDVLSQRKGCWFYCAIGNNAIRETVSQLAAECGLRPATLIHPNVVVARHVSIGEGTYVGPGCILSPNARLGRHVIVNQRVSVGHDARMDDFSQACPGAQINGGCTLERGALVGSNASIHQGRSVGAYGVVGANSQVIRSVPPRTSVCGVPAKQLSTNPE